MKDNEKYLEGRYEIQGRDFVDAGLVSSRIKKSLKAMGVAEDVIRRVAVLTFEAEVNIISYATQGTISYYVLPDTIIIEAIDVGPGIIDIEQAMQEGFSTADDSIREMGFGAGMGLANIKRSSDIFEITSEPGIGTCVKCTLMIKGRVQSEET
jgi:anti-sigma regulatory factor (Ser/Thr protein kinase)